MLFSLLGDLYRFLRTMIPCGRAYSRLPLQCLGSHYSVQRTRLEMPGPQRHHLLLGCRLHRIMSTKIIPSSETAHGLTQMSWMLGPSWRSTLRDTARTTPLTGRC